MENHTSIEAANVKASAPKYGLQWSVGGKRLYGFPEMSVVQIPSNIWRRTGEAERRIS